MPSEQIERIALLFFIILMIHILIYLRFKGSNFRLQTPKQEMDSLLEILRILNTKE